MDNIKFDVEKEKSLGVGIPEPTVSILNALPKFIVAITANPKTLNESTLIKKVLKIKTLNMVQLIENIEMHEGIIKVTYNKGKEKEIELNVKKAIEENQAII